MPTSAHPARTQNPSNLAWLDLEMTGLDAERDVILQAALIITDSELRPLEEFACDIWQPEEALRGMSPFVREMHTRTGLLQRIAPSRTDIGAAERLLLERVAGWCPFPAVLCGNSIGQDRRFIDRYMPGLARYLHYRLLDVTSVKILARSWYGEGAVYAKPAEGAHDALVDIKNSIAELSHYKNTLFRPRET
jgi:oligoribonuclease